MQIHSYIFYVVKFEMQYGFTYIKFEILNFSNYCVCQCQDMQWLYHLNTGLVTSLTTCCIHTGCSYKIVCNLCLWSLRFNNFVTSLSTTNIIIRQLSCFLSVHSIHTCRNLSATLSQTVSVRYALPNSSVVKKLLIKQIIGSCDLVTRCIQYQMHLSP